MFKLNDKVIYPGHGVANVESITEKVIAGTSVLFIKLSFLFKDMTILVPIYNADSIGLRYPSTSKGVKDSMDELCRKPEKKLESLDFTPSGWNKRNKDYQLKIQGGRLLDIVKIYRDLMYISLQKELSFGERTLLQNVEDLIAQELQVVKSLSRDAIIQDIRTPFKHITDITQMCYSGPDKLTQV